MDTYTIKSGDKVYVEGGRFEVEKLIRLVRENEIVRWSLVCEVPAEQVSRRVVVFSNYGKKVVPWVEYRDIIRNRDGCSFIYDGVQDRFYLPGGQLKSALDSPVMCSVLTYLAQNRHEHTALEISAGLFLDQKDETAAIRQAIQRLRNIDPDLILRGGIGYHLNPDRQWLIIRETGA